MQIGIDLGGTKIEGIAIDGGRELLRRRVATPRGDYDATIRAIAALVAAIEQELGQTGSVGVGIPGAISATTGLVKNANSTWLIGNPLDRDLERALSRSVRVSNDANCFALSEATDGAAKGARTVFGVILGTGTGGRHRGRRAGARRASSASPANGATIPFRGRRTTSGRVRRVIAGGRGCIETFLSGPGSVIDLCGACGAAARTRRKSPLAAGSGDATAALALDIYEDRLARALASIINVLDPDVIVLGGGLSNITPPLRPGARTVAAFRFLRYGRYTSCARSPRRFQRGPRRGLVMEGMTDEENDEIQIQLRRSAHLCPVMDRAGADAVAHAAGNWEVDDEDEHARHGDAADEADAVRHARDGEESAGVDSERPGRRRLQDERLQAVGEQRDLQDDVHQADR